jgi:hypothetical protein
MKQKKYGDMQYHLDEAQNELRQAQECLASGAHAKEMISNISEQINTLSNLLCRIHQEDIYNILGN